MSVISVSMPSPAWSSEHMSTLRPLSRAGMDCIRSTFEACRTTSTGLCLAIVAIGIVALVVALYLFIRIAAPSPRPIIPSERQYRHIEPNGRVSQPKPLSCWQDQHDAVKEVLRTTTGSAPEKVEIEPPELFLSVIVPAYNEEKRMGIMLSDAVAYLEQAYPATPPANGHTTSPQLLQANGHTSRASSRSPSPSPSPSPTRSDGLSGWEIIVVSDGSTDGTVDVAMRFAAGLKADTAPRIRVVELAKNRGKGGAVTHGLKHARGAYAIFADADGATRFRDISYLLTACRAAEDAEGRAVAVGSRTHLRHQRERRKHLAQAAARHRSNSRSKRRGSSGDILVTRSWFRTFLMRSFHLLLWCLTPAATGRISDTQCGFKLFSRSALRDIVPYMHCEGWIFDVEMLMLAEAAGIPVLEVPVSWHEVGGSKLNVVKDSLGMAYGLALLRAAWAFGVYTRT